MAEEYRVVCAHFGEAGHSQHKWPKANQAKALQSVIDQDHHAEMHPGLWYAGEAPYQVQSREVSAWK